MQVQLVEDSEAGNLDRLTKTLGEELDGAVVDDTSVEPEVTSEPEVTLPAKLQGKSLKDIADMYANLESAYGRMANDLGTQRQITDRLLDLKRTTDLGDNTPSPKAAKVSREDILADDPTPAIERVIDAKLKPITDALNGKIGQIDANTQQTAFINKHPDYAQIAADPEFAKWIAGSGLRLRAAQAAKGGDWAQADDLLTEYKQTKTVQKQTKQEQRKVDIEGARQAGHESGSASSDAGNGTAKGKIYRRADLIKLRMDDPERYYSDEFQAVIMKAYNEKRVK